MPPKAIALTASPHYPILYQVNTRVLLTELSHSLGHAATLDDIPDATIDQWSSLGCEWIWLLSVWQTGPDAQRISRTNPHWHHEFQQTLSDLTDADIGGSGFAIYDYSVHTALGGNDSFIRLRERMRQRGLKVMLDFVPNHMAPDHPWINTHPEYFVAGNDTLLREQPNNYRLFETVSGRQLFAYGRDPYFDGWPDTIQLNYGNPELQSAMLQQLSRIAELCDGVRCDMAMLVLPEIFKRTWGIDAEPFWQNAINSIRAEHGGFVFLAEVYWGMEWTLQQLGFDYCYDKLLYDRLRDGHAIPVKQHFWAGLDYQDRLARFLENHDEQRAASVFELGKHRAAAMITYLSPGMKFFYDGQFEGFRVRVSPHLIRAPKEAADESVHTFYERLLDTLRKNVVRNGHWQLIDAQPYDDVDPTCNDLIVFQWTLDGEESLRVVVNLSDHPSRGRVFDDPIELEPWGFALTYR